MDITRYDESIRNCDERYRNAIAAHDSEAAERAAMQMLRHAKKRDDVDLCVCAYTLLANIAYFQTGDYHAFLKNLKAAIHYLQRSHDELMMKSIYYLIAVHALNNGMYDVAYSYTLIALDIARRAGLSMDIGTLEEMAGYIQLSMGGFERAQNLTQSGIKHISKETAHPYYHTNLFAGYLNEGAACLALGRLSRASALYEKACAFILKNNDKVYPEDRFHLARFGAHLALFEEDTRQMKRCLKQMRKWIGEVSLPTDEMQDIYNLGIVLAQKGQFKVLGELLEIFSMIKLPADTVDACRMLIDLKVTYYTGTGDMNKLRAAYREQDAVYARIEEERKRSYPYIMDLIRLVERMKTDRDASRREHDTLLKQANTDALTGLNNRHALNRYLEETFRQALMHGMSLGVVLIDVDGLKRYNDEYGHAAGDQCLIEIAQMLMTIAKESGVYAARYGGDEFALIFTGKTDRVIRNRLKKLHDNAPLPFSHGIYNCVPGDRTRIWDYLAGADEALYRMKRR